MAPMQIRTSVERLGTPDISGSKVLRAAMGLDLFHIDVKHSGPPPLLGNEWPFETTRVSLATGDR